MRALPREVTCVWRKPRGGGGGGHDGGLWERGEAGNEMRVTEITSCVMTGRYRGGGSLIFFTSGV
jgi:hypothetical protein